MSKSTDLSCLLAEALLGNKGERVPCICPGGMMNMITSEMMGACSSFWPKAHVDAETMAKLAEFPCQSSCDDHPAKEKQQHFDRRKKWIGKKP